jgi:TonB family protein
MLTLLAAAAVQASAPPAPPPPPAYRPHLIDYEAGEARCGGRVVPVLVRVAPFTHASLVGANPPRAVEMRFTLDADGRPIGISPSEFTISSGYSFVPDADLTPAFSLWRFASGRGGVACTMTFTPRTRPIADASDADILRVSALRGAMGAAQRAVFDRIRQIDCGGARRPQPLLRAYPDRARLPREAGSPSYAVVGFDIDADGVPAQVAIVTSSGNAAFDRAAIDAAERGRYPGGQPRQRCTIPMLLGPTPVAAPPSPDTASFRPEGANCPDKIDWAQPFAKNYPDAFRRRSIEGWAVVGFDLAPWGTPGEIKILASEPAQAFGDAARRIIQSARAKASASGARGCVTKIHFRMPPVESADDDAPAF